MSGEPQRARQVHGSAVLHVGDSHTVMCTRAGGYPAHDVDAETGRSSAGALEIVERMLDPGHEVVIFDVATNDFHDQAAYERNLDKLRAVIGGRPLILVNCWRTDTTLTHREVNAMLLRYARRDRYRVSLVDWASWVDANPEAIGPKSDLVHFTPEAYAARARMVRRAVKLGPRRTSWPRHPRIVRARRYGPVRLY